MRLLALALVIVAFGAAGAWLLMPLADPPGLAGPGGQPLNADPDAGDDPPRRAGSDGQPDASNAPANRAVGPRTDGPEGADDGVGTGSAIVGSVHIADSGEPAVGARVVLHAVSARLPEATGDDDSSDRPLFTELAGDPSAIATADGEGRFAVHLPDRRHRLVVASHPGYLPRAALVRGDGPTTTRLDLLLQAAEPRTWRIVDPEGVPIAGARIRIWVDDEFAGPPFLTIVADGGGAATVDLPRDAGYAIGASGYGTVYGEDPPNGDPPEFVLHPGFQVGGVVVDAAGAPIAGARVAIDRPTGPDTATITDAEGRFRFVDEAQGPWNSGEVSLGATAPGHETQHQLVTAGNVRVRFVIGAERPFVGRIVLPDGTAVQPPAFVARRISDGRWGRAWLDGVGRYVVERPGLQPLRLSASMERDGRRYAGEVDMDETHIAAGEGPTLTMRDVGPVEAFRSVVRVRLRGSDGRPLAGVGLSSSFPAPARDPRERVAPPQTDEQGLVEFTVAVPPGETDRLQIGRCACQGRWYLPPAEGAVLTSRADDGFDEVVLPRAVRVTFVPQEPDGTPIGRRNGTGLWLEGDREMMDYDRDVTERGRHAAWVLPGSRYRLALLVPDYIIHRVGAWVAPAEDAEIGIRLAHGLTLLGRLVDPQGRPVRGAMLWLHWGDPEVTLTEGAGHGTAYSEADGRVAVSGLEPGPARLTVRCDDGRLALLRTIRVPEVGPLDLCDVQVGHRQVHGEVVDEAGTALGGVRVEPVAGMFDSLHSSSHADGRFVVSVPEEGDVVLVFMLSGYGTRVLRPDEAARVVMGPGGRVVAEAGGANVSLDGVSVAGRAVAWHVPWEFHGAGMAWCDLPAGPVELTFDVHGAGLQTRRVQILPGETVTVRLDSPRAGGR